MCSYVIWMGPEPVTIVLIEENLDTHTQRYTCTHAHMHTPLEENGKENENAMW